MIWSDQTQGITHFGPTCLSCFFLLGFLTWLMIILINFAEPANFSLELNDCSNNNDDDYENYDKNNSNKNNDNNNNNGNSGMTSRFNLVLTSALLKPLLRYRPNPQMWSLMLTLCIRKHIQVQVSVKEMAYSTQLWRRSRKSITEEYTLYWSQNEANEFKAIINTSAIPVVTYTVTVSTSSTGNLVI